MTKSIPFMIQVNVPRDISEGDTIEFDGAKCKVTKIKSVKFLDMRTMKVIGLCKEKTAKELD